MGSFSSTMMVQWWVDNALRSLSVAAVAGLLLLVLRIRDANIQHRTWTLVLMTMMVLPALCLILPVVESPIWLPAIGSAEKEAVSVQRRNDPVAPRVVAADVGKPAAMPLGVEQSTPPAESGAFEETSAVSEPVPWTTIAAAVYVAIAVMLLARVIFGIILTRRMVGRGRRLTTTDHPAFIGEVPFVESIEVRTPATVGIWRPVILLPSDWRTWNTETLQMAIAHESFHVRRRDALVALVANMNVALYWLNPLSWFLRWRLADLAERVCDDEVLRTHGDHATYAETLLAMASRLTGSERVSPLVVPMARKAQVETRIEAIIDDDRPLCRRLGWRGAVVMLLIALPLIVVAAAVQQAQTAEVGGKTTDSVGDGRVMPQRSLSGRVVSDADDSAVSGAEVRLTGWNENRTRYDLKTVISDDDGKFRFEDLPDGRLQLIAIHEDTASRTERYQGLKVAPGDNAIELRMKPVPALRVKVVDKATQKPLSGATVRLTWTDGARDHTTDGNGEVVIKGLTPELWTIEVFAEGYAEREEAIQLSGTEITAVTAMLDPGFVVEGVVVDEKHKPLEGVGISVFPRDHSGGQIEYLKTDAEGTYRFGHLPLVGLQFGFSKDNFADQRLDIAPQVGPGKTQRLDVTLSPRQDGGFVEGTVVSSEGDVVVGASVTNIGRSSRDLRKTFTDADGRFRLDDAFEGIHGYMLVVKSPGYAPGIAEFSPGTRDKPTRIAVVLKPGHRLRGQVVDEQGEPLAGIYVGYDGQIGFGRDGDGSFVVTEADGRFQFDSLPAYARFDIRTYNTAGKFSALHEHKLPLDGEEEVVVTLPAEGVIRGRVVDAATDKPLPTFVAKVTFSPDRTNDDPNGTLFGPRATGEGETFSSPQGDFRMGSFTQGMPLQITIEADGYERAVTRRVVARRDSEAEPIEFRLQPIEKGKLVSFAGQVVDQTGNGVGGVDLRLIVSKERRATPRDEFPYNWAMVRSGGLGKVAEVVEFLAATSGPAGRFEFDNVIPGAEVELAYWGLGVSQDRLARLEELNEADRQNLRIEITAPGTVVGSFDRKRFPDVDDVVLSGNGDFFRGRLIGKDATYRIENVPPGDYELQLYRQVAVPGERFRQTEVLHRLPVLVKSGETTEVDVE